jgi:trimeric autotransporter adhesin
MPNNIQAAASSAGVRLTSTSSSNYANSDEHRAQTDVVHADAGYTSAAPAAGASGTGRLGASSSTTADDDGTIDTLNTAAAAAGTAQSPAYSDGRGVHRLFKAVAVSDVTNGDVPSVTSVTRGKSSNSMLSGSTTGTAATAAAAAAVEDALSSADESTALQARSAGASPTAAIRSSSDIKGESPMNDVALTSSPRVHAAVRPTADSSNSNNSNYTDLRCSVAPHTTASSNPAATATTTSSDPTATAAAASMKVQNQYHSGTECLSSVLNSPTGFLAGCLSDTDGSNTTGGESLDGESLITLLQQQLQFPTADHTGHTSTQQQQQQQQQAGSSSSYAVQRAAATANIAQQQQQQQQQQASGSSGYALQQQQRGAVSESSQSFSDVDNEAHSLTSAATVAKLNPAAAAAAAMRVQRAASQRMQRQHSCSYADAARDSSRPQISTIAAINSDSGSSAAVESSSNDTALQHYRTVTFSDDDTETALNSGTIAGVQRSRSSTGELHASQAFSSSSSRQQLQQYEDTHQSMHGANLGHDRQIGRSHSTQRQQQQRYSSTDYSSDEQYQDSSQQHAVQHSAFGAGLASSSYRGAHPEERYNTTLQQHSSMRSATADAAITASFDVRSVAINSTRREQQQRQGQQQQQQQQQCLQSVSAHVQCSSSDQRQAQYAVDSSDWLTDDPNDAIGYAFASDKDFASERQHTAAEHHQQHYSSSSGISNQRSGVAAAVRFDSQQRVNSTTAAASSVQHSSSSSNSRSDTALQQAGRTHSTNRSTTAVAAATGAAKRQRSARSRSSTMTTTTTAGSQRQDSSGSLESVGSSLCSNYSGSDLCRNSGSANFETTLGFTRSIVVIKGNRDDLAGALLEASEAGNDDEIDVFSDDNLSLHSDQDDYFAQRQQQQQQLELQRHDVTNDTDADRAAVLAAAEQEYTDTSIRSVGSGSREQWLLQQQLEDEQFELEQQQQQEQQHEQELSYQDSSSSMPTYR